jgi:hypothetical protein
VELVLCPECGRDVEEDAPNCPRCGHLMGLVPLAEPFEPIPPRNPVVVPRRERRARGKSLNLGRIAAALLLGLVIVAAMFGALLWRGVLH